MQIKPQATSAPLRTLRYSLSQKLMRGLGAILIAALTLTGSISFAAQSKTQTPPTTSTTPPPQTPPPDQQQNQRPGALPPALTQLPPNSGTAPLNPNNEAQQSVSPQTGPEQQRQQTTPNTTGPLPISPQVQPPSQNTVPGAGTPTTATPAGTIAPQTTNLNQNAPATSGAGVSGVQLAPGQNVGITPGIAPAELPSAPPPVAPDFKAPMRPLPSAERVGVDVTNQVPLSLNEAISLALKNNNDIDASRIDVRIAEFQLNAARGVYDPLLSSENFFERRVTPVSSTIGGAGGNGSVTQTDATGDARIGGYTPFAGGSYQLDFSSTRLTTNNQNATLNPQYPTSLTFTYTQPILRGRSFDNNRRQIEIAKKNLSLTDAEFRQRAISVITQVEEAYWDLVFALRNLQVQIDAVKQARVQVESNQRLVEKGVLAPIDIVAASTQVTSFEQNVYTAQQGVTLAENTLKTLLLPDRAAPLWSRAITPITPVNLEAPRVPLEQAVAAALANRPELAQLKTNADINDINARYYREQAKPQVDVVGTYNPVGLSGTSVVSGPSATQISNAQLLQRVNDLSALAGLAVLPPSPVTTRAAPPNLVGGYGQSLAGLFAQDFPTARVGVRVSLPLRNRTAEANLGGALAEGTRLQRQRAQQEQLIEADVRNMMQAVRSAEARLAAAAATRASAEQLYESQLRQFKAGTTTVFLVLQRQTDLLAARGNELQAQTLLNKAISEFQRASASTLEANNVAILSDGARRDLQLRPAPSNANAADITVRSSANKTDDGASVGAPSLSN